MSKLCGSSLFSYLPIRKTLAIPAISYRRQLGSCSCSAKKFRKKAKSNEELRTELREFIIAVGFPRDHLPSLKDLADNGRADLANIVRRKGYKLVQDLLANEKTSCDAYSSKNHKTVNVGTSSGRKRHVNGSVDTPFFSSNNSMTQKTTGFSNSSVDERVEKFILTGELDSFKDDDFGVLEGSKSNESSVSLEKEFLNEYANSCKGIAEEPTNFPSSSFQVLFHDLFPSPHQNSFQMNEQEDQVDHLKLMLLQKERELLNIKEQIESEKNALSSVQKKAEAEIKMAEDLVSEKDAELIIAEESLSGLLEVKVQYNGNGEEVELAGSFNGWQHRIQMDPEEQTKTTLMKSSGWTASLWLYPGVYEIKFVVDGQWVVDPEKEMVYLDHICNNVLRVS